MNTVLDLIKERKSVRQFEKSPIKPDIKREILSSAYEAPTAGNMMLYTILDITDQSIKDRLAVLCDNQPFIAQAPMVFVFLADYQRWHDTFVHAGCNPRNPGEGDAMLACADAVIAAQNTVIAAESLGIGSCYIGDILEQYESVKELLELPDYVIPAAMLVYGYPTESQKKRIKPARFEAEYMTFENTYRRQSGKSLEEMHQKRNKKRGISEISLNDDIKAFCERKYNSSFAREMTRSAAKYLSNFRKQ